MALHEAYHILHQQISLSLHDGSRIGAHEENEEIVA